MIAFLRPGDAFPPVESALREPDGLLCAGADLSPERLLEAYRHGIFPWFSHGQPILWWSPDPRMVLRTAEFRVSRSLAKNRRNRGYSVRVDTAFEQVLEQCAAPRDGEPGTWLGPQMRAAYAGLHRLGHAHSVETWRDGRLVGGLYGVALGRMFFGESMFSRETDASKVALAALVDALRACDWPLVDCQVHTPLLESLGARAIPRREFLRALSPLVNYRSPPEPWNLVAA